MATANPQAPGGIEVTEPVITALTEPAATPPVELWRPTMNASLPTLLDHAPVTWRHPAQRVKWELAAASLRGFRDTLDAAGFTEIHTPKFVASATESGANVFQVDYFGRPAYLAQSPQFYKQQMVGVFERVYEVGPVFRAEPHDTVRHLAEYVSLDAELGFIEDHRDVLRVLRDVLAGMVAAVHEHAGPAVALSGAEVPVVPEEIPVLHFRDALKLVGAPEDEPDLAPEHERALGAWALAEHGSDFVAVEGYPMAQAAVLHPRPARRPALEQQLRPALPRAGAGDGWPAAAPALGVRRRDPGPRRGPGGVRGVPPGVRARHAPARRLRDRARALDRPAGAGGEHPRGDALPARPQPPGALTHHPRGDRWDVIRIGDPNSHFV